jgi:hypothetical protein
VECDDGRGDHLCATADALLFAFRRYVAASLRMAEIT